MECPQCRSKKVEQETKLSYAECDYCSNEFYPVNLFEIAQEFRKATKVLLPDFQKSLPITEVTERQDRVLVYLEGTQGGEYKLYLDETHTGLLKRKKGGSERNQFGSRWTNGSNTWPEGLQ